MKYECIKQFDETDCAAACISTLCRHYGLKKGITNIRELAGTDKNGTNGNGIIKALTALGFEVAGFALDDKDIYCREITLPCIAHVNKVDCNHYMIIHDIEPDKIVVADPAEGIVKYTKEKFLEIWSGVLFLVKPTCKIMELEDDKCKISLIDIIGKQKKFVVGILICSVIYTAIGIMSTLLFQVIFDKIIPENSVNVLAKIALGLCIVYLIGGIMQFLRVKMMLILGKRFDMELTYNSYEHIMHLPMNFFSSRQTGEIISRLNDASKIRDALSGATISAVLDMFMAIIAAVVLFMINKKLFVIVCIIGLMYFILNFLFIEKIKKNNQTVMEKNSQTNAMFIETVKGAETIKACGAERTICDNSKKIFVSLLNAAMHSQEIESIVTIISGIISNCGYVVVLWIGVGLIVQGKMSIGTLLMFYSLIGYFFSPVESLMSLQTSLQGAVVAFERLQQMLSIDKEKTGTEEDDICAGEINVENLSFQYGTRKHIIKDMSFSIHKNEKIAIVGESGSGKTTLARLLLGFYDVRRGSIKFGDKDICDINKKVLRKKIAYVSQEPYFFKGTLKENILFGNNDLVSEMDIIKVLEQVKLDKYIDENPEGMHTKLQENATNLSGGQRQRLSLARALIRKPEVLILDEATSNLDVITEKSITESIDSIKGMTIIVIAHRLSTIKRCDRIFAICDGKIKEAGTHDELMHKKGFYYSLWKEQL